MSNVSMTNCKKGGIKIKETNNGYKEDPFANVNPFVNEAKRENVTYDSSSYTQLDLNIDNYSRADLYKLFGLQVSITLSEDIMKECKKLVLKTHPDKARIDEKYFVFFSQAYKKLLTIYEFQNKTNSKKTEDKSEYFDSNNGQILDNWFDTNKKLKDPKDFNKWFNQQFEKHKLEDPTETGYGSWLKSDDDIVFTPTGVTKDKMAAEMEKRKKQVQTMTTYTGVNELTAHSLGGSSLMAYDSNFTSGSLFSNEGMGYTDLRQAYVESVIPVTEDDYRKMPKFNSMDEYKRHRDTTNIVPLSKEEAMRQLYQQDKQKDQESAALAFYYAQQSEKVKKNDNEFWTGLKQVTNW
jgi:curved DNA-binding protein CbpA